MVDSVFQRIFELNFCYSVSLRCSSLDEILILFRWTREEKDNLLKYYNQSKESSDTIAKITEKYEESGTRRKTPFSIIQELQEQNIISENEYNNLMRNNNVERRDSSVDEDKCEYPLVENHETSEHLDSDIKVLKEYLYKENKGKYLIWLQNLLLKACYVKLDLNNSEEFGNKHSIMEPTVYYYTCEYLRILLNIVIQFDSQVFRIVEIMFVGFFPFPFIIYFYK